MKPELVRIALRHLPCTRSVLARKMGYTTDATGKLVVAMIQNGYATAEVNDDATETITPTGKTMEAGSLSAVCAQLFLLVRKEATLLSKQQTRLKNHSISAQQYAEGLERMDRRIESFIEVNFK